MSQRGIHGHDKAQKADVDGQRKTDGPTRAERRAAAGPASPTTHRRQAVDQDALQRFQEAVEGQECLWWDGDLRDGSAAFCGHARERGRYCYDHHARVYADQRKRHHE